MHGLPHGLDQPLQPARTELPLVRCGRAPQHGIARGDDRQRQRTVEQGIDLGDQRV
ncbi:hypothetical protein SLNHY_7270 [Streptomyces albus]|nr:hypothetical protein SLNHY_7270 [Streptomyces albus]